jgi:uncharacterized membrane protein
MILCRSIILGQPALTPFGINAGTVVGGAVDADGNPIANFTYNSKKGTFTTLTPAPGSLETGASGINEPGEIVGSTFDGVTTRLRSQQERGVYDLLAPGFELTQARANNNHGVGHRILCR